MTKKKCFYIVSENSCLDPYTGAGKHIEIGLDELAKQYDVELVLFCEPFSIPDKSLAPGAKVKRWHFLRRYFRLYIKWWLVLIQNHTGFFRFYNQIKRTRPDIIYERAAFMNFNGLFIAKLLNIPHNYEVNGLYFKDKAFIYAKMYSKLFRAIEKIAYKSTNCFFVGGLNAELNIPDGPKAHVVQNGIETDFLDFFRDSLSIGYMGGGTLNIVFVGHAMSHHRVDILIEAIQAMDCKNNVCLHLIGSNFEKSFKNLDTEGIRIIEYGMLNHSQMSPLLKEMHVGIVPFALPYYSNMKVFLYAAAKLILVLPRVRNFQRIFSENEAVFFENLSAEALTRSLDGIFNDPSRYKEFGNNAFSRVDGDYTWPRIFEGVANHMESA